MLDGLVKSSKTLRKLYNALIGKAAHILVSCYNNSNGQLG